MRQKDCSTNSFRRLLARSALDGLRGDARHADAADRDRDAARDHAPSPVIDGKKTVFSSSARRRRLPRTACSVVPGARIGHIGLYRDPKTLVAVEYYFKMPQDMHERDAIVLDPMLATGNSAVAAVDRLKETQAEVDPLRLPARRARGPDELPRQPPRRAGLHRGHRPRAQRAWLHPARPGRCGRPAVRHRVASGQRGGRWQPLPAITNRCQMKWPKRSGVEDEEGRADE